MKAPVITMREEYTLQIESEMQTNVKTPEGVRQEVYTYIVSIMRVRDWCPQQEIIVEGFFEMDPEVQGEEPTMTPVKQEVNGYYEEYGFSKEDLLKFCEL